jgi:hypothetical protein
MMSWFLAMVLGSATTGNVLHLPQFHQIIDADSATSFVGLKKGPGGSHLGIVKLPGQIKMPSSFGLTVIL